MKDFKDVGAHKTLPLTNTPKNLSGICAYLKEKETLMQTYKEYEKIDAFWNLSNAGGKRYFLQKECLRKEINTVKHFIFEMHRYEQTRIRLEKFSLNKYVELWQTEQENAKLRKRIEILEIEVSVLKSLVCLQEEMLKYPKALLAISELKQAA